MRPFALLVLLFLAVVAGPARAETENCTNITALPTTISTQGIYCLKQDLTTSITSGAAIAVTTNNVTIDCNGWKLGGLAAGSGTNAIGVHAAARLNVTIRNCGIRGFRYGVYLQGSEGGYHLVEGSRFDLNTETAIYALGDGNTIRGNRIYDTGGRPGAPAAEGIDASNSTDIIDNTVAGVWPVGPNGSAIGIKANGNTGGEISRNRVSALNNIGAEGYRAYAIWANGGYPIIRDNSVHNGGTLTAEDWGIVCNNAMAIARDNVVLGFSAPGRPIHVCTSVNNTAP